MPELQLAQTNQDEINTLKLARLSEQEIELYLQYREKKDLLDIRLSKIRVEPNILLLKLEEIKLKLELLEKGKLNNDDIDSVSKDPFAYIAQLSKQIDDKIQQKRKRAKRNSKNEQIVSDPLSKWEDKLDPSIYHVSVMLEESDILENRISIEEIRKFERFKDYSPGSPSNVSLAVFCFSFVYRFHNIYSSLLCRYCTLRIYTLKLTYENWFPYLAGLIRRRNKSSIEY